MNFEVFESPLFSPTFFLPISIASTMTLTLSSYPHTTLNSFNFPFPFLFRRLLTKARL